jgi:hypothetical protein
MVFKGVVWYVVSILALIGAYHKLFDFFYMFQDLMIFSTGLSLFYSWQTYEKDDLSLTDFYHEQREKFRSFWYGEKYEDELDLSTTISGEELQRMREKS